MKRQDIAAGGVLVLDGKALMIRRSTEDTTPGYWEFPKGRVEFGESPKEAVKREFLEETGLKIEPISLHDAYSRTYKSKEGIDVHFVEIEYLVELAEGESIDNLKIDPQAHDAWRMVGKDDQKALEPMFESKRRSLLRAFET